MIMPPTAVRQFQVLSKIWIDAGLPAECKPKARAYDFRHHFAFTNINRWVENGINVNGCFLT
jgi:hypothetical protein